MNEKARLRRVLSTPRLTLYGLGTILGAGIYVLVGEVAGKAGTAAPIAYVIAAAIALLSGLTFAELAARHPVSAGEAAYVDEAFSLSWLTIAVGWTVVFTGVVSAATLISGFVGYLAVFVELPAFMVITMLALAMGAVAAWGVGVSATAAAVITVIEALGLLLVIGLSADAFAELPVRWQELAPEPTAGAWLGIGWASVLAFYAFIGFEDMVNLAEEVKKPERAMPFAIIASVILATLFYVVIALLAVLVMPPDELAASEAPLADTLARQGHSPVVISLISLFAIVNGALVQLIMASRVLYGLADRGRAPRLFRRVHPRTRTPIAATAVATGIIWLAALALTVVVLAQLTSLAILCVFATVNLAAIRLKRRSPPPPGAPDYPLAVPIAALVLCIVLIVLQIALGFG
jgi:basic amino acid/polyamine antiporter, APA family